MRTSLTGLNKKGFEALLPSFAHAYSESVAQFKLIGFYRYAEITLGKKMALPERKLRRVDEFIERFPTLKRAINDFDCARSH